MVRLFLSLHVKANLYSKRLNRGCWAFAVLPGKCIRGKAGLQSHVHDCGSVADRRRRHVRRARGQSPRWATGKSTTLCPSSVAS